MSVFVTWLGHAGFKLEVVSASGPKIVYIDPWLNSPVCPEAEKHPQTADLILLSHGHFDHASDAPGLSKETGAQIAASYELCSWAESKGVTNVYQMNKGGSLETDYLTAHLVAADHSGSGPEGGYTGDACGWVINFKNGAPSIYHAGDSNVFGDMRIICDLYAPKIALLPIGGKFTMGPYEAAYAVKKLLHSVDTVVPMHYGTFPPLTGTPEQLTHELQKLPERPSIKVHNLVIGERTPLESLL
jgi:L-ascorbate metabolism protein UlaG (beta-lactamase superfamily)